LRRSEQVDRIFNSLRISDQKIRTELAWTPPYTLEQGLQATAAWYRSVYPR
jgi:UDP-glucose 4-epimerase